MLLLIDHTSLDALRPVVLQSAGDEWKEAAAEAHRVYMRKAKLRMYSGDVEEQRRQAREAYAADPETRRESLRRHRERKRKQKLLERGSTFVQDLEPAAENSVSESTLMLLGTLSDQERLVAQGLLRGLRPGAIAKELSVRSSSVSTARRRVAEKLGFDHRADTQQLLDLFSKKHNGGA